MPPAARDLAAERRAGYDSSGNERSTKLLFVRARRHRPRCGARPGAQALHVFSRQSRRDALMPQPDM